MGDTKRWLRDFILEFRKQSDKLSDEERSRISNLDDFFAPCQILLLWFRDVNLQYLICMHDNSRKDMEIEIEGPFPTYETIDRMDSILKKPKYDRELSEEEKKHVFDKTITFSRLLESVFLNLKQEIQKHLFMKPPDTSVIGPKNWLTSRSFLWAIRGNIVEIDKLKMVTEIIEQAKKQAIKVKTKPVASSPPKPVINSCSTFFYPPIWVGKVPQRTFKEKARGAFLFPKKALNVKYKGRVVVINQDGLIAIGEENIPKATRLLNEIMATFLLLGLEASALRELELCEAKIDSSSLSITQWGTRADTMRTQQSLIFPPKQLILESRIEVRKEKIIEVIQQAERISKDPDISDFLTFFLEAHTHLENSEYSQSFIMSWVIVERHLHWLWRKFLKEEQIPRKRRDKLTNPVYWTTDFILEGLNIGGRLIKKDYEDFMSLKIKRNDIIHLGESPSFEEAKKCFKIAKNIVKQRSGLD